VRTKIIDFLNELIDIGVAGFRIDAAKHVWPDDLKFIYAHLHNLNTNHFESNSRAFIYQEVIDLGGEAVKKTEYIGAGLGAVEELKYSVEIGKAFQGKSELKWLQNWNPEWNLLQSRDALVCIDNHDSQRGHGAGGSDILTYKSKTEYLQAISFMLSHPYGTPRIMSSYAFNSGDQGPLADAHGNILSPTINPHTGQCENGWICEHRWPEIVSMIRLRNTMGTERVQISNWWSNGKNQIAYTINEHAFVAINKEKIDMNIRVATHLKCGVYCDVFSGRKEGNKCTGHQVVVTDSFAEVRITKEVEMIAIHVDEKL